MLPVSMTSGIPAPLMSISRAVSHGVCQRLTFHRGMCTGGTLERDKIVCPRHGAHFSIKTGNALTPPGMRI